MHDPMTIKSSPVPEESPFSRPENPQQAPLFHYAWTQKNQCHPPEAALESPLLALNKTSDVNDIEPEQIADARRVLRLKRELAQASRNAGGSPEGEFSLASAKEAADRTEWIRNEVRVLQRRIVERFLRGRRKYYGEEQCRPFDNAHELALEGRNIFIIIKFMDEAPHIKATLQSLIHQQQLDMGRVVIVTADNNSTDGSDQIVKEVIAANKSKARIIYTNQTTPGGGSAARYGVDRCIATIYEMCLHDSNWDRLQSSYIGVSDGDTVYHHHLVKENVALMEEDQTVDGVMPFLAYKLTAALRLFRNYACSFPEDLALYAEPGATLVPVNLSNTDAQELIPRSGRKLLNDRTMRLEIQDHPAVTIPLANKDSRGRRFATLQDEKGHKAYILDDRTLVLAEAPVSGLDGPMVFLENSGVKPDEKWRWHAVIGHDLFLYWAFVGMGIPEEMVYPDTSDALKMFRTWSFAIGGQHQLSRPDLKIVTGTDYQSGRVLQATGCTVRLGPAYAYTETEIDRLTKMIRNFSNQQSVFYGETRGSAIERASGLYLHMTRIQLAVEEEIRDYSDEFFQQIAFPERVLFPLRWMFQNAIRFYAHYEPEAQQAVRERFLDVIFAPEVADQIEQKWFRGNMNAIREAEYTQLLCMAEQIAEGIIANHYRDIMVFYKATLRSFFHAQKVQYHFYEWLLEGLESSRNAIAEERPRVHPSVVWQGKEFVIDSQRGQVTRMRNDRNLVSSASPEIVGL
ncbi:MAG TPA: glycosyltransferase family A protein [Candidatus Angelobacter sp.]|nr:glycosyltransferase family A protein [Candidatus Angelobacter sp.]